MTRSDYPDNTDIFARKAEGRRQGAAATARNSKTRFAA